MIGFLLASYLLLLGYRVQLAWCHERHVPSGVPRSLAFLSLPRHGNSHGTSQTLLSAKASSKKRAGTSSAALKGFGSPLKNSIPTDKSPTTRSFLEYIDVKGAGENLKRTSLGFFPASDAATLRGVVALKDLKKGDDIISIPYEVAINLGPQGDDPTLPAVKLLRSYCDCHHTQAEPLQYFKMLPEFQGTDCLGSTDFYSDAALSALQSPMIVEETLQRRALTERRFQSDVASDSSFPIWIDGTPVTHDHLAWAVWIITSRVLTVQADANSEQTYRLLIPYLDMCNHDRSSPHMLTGRACESGQLRVVAGAPIKAGTQVNIPYGVAGNDRFIQDYGFLDTSTPEGFRLVAQQLLGKVRIREGRYLNKFMPDADRDRTLERLRETTMAQDQELLQQKADLQVRLAIEYRWRLKQALAEFINIA